MGAVPDHVRKTLAALSQEHLLRIADKLDEAGRNALFADIETIQPAQLAILRAAIKPQTISSAPFTPYPFLQLDDANFPYRLHRDAREATAHGETLLREGKVAALVVAGGEGTRLGFNRPKGFFPIYPVSGRCLFDGFAAQLRVIEKRFGRAVPWYVMTSRATHDATVKGFKEAKHYDLNPINISFFTQGESPVLAPDGRLLLDASGRIVRSPDGHGGCIEALACSRMLDDMKKRGVEWIYYFQVDNAMERVCDPALVGVTASKDADAGVKVVRKQEPGEKVGVLVERDDHASVVEYTELSETKTNERDTQGRLRYCAGNTAIHVFRRSFLERVAGESLPWHAAFKAVPHMDEAGKIVTPPQPNAYKFERFIFDVFPRAKKLVALEVPRRRDFVPLKDASGPRSPEGVRKEMQAEWRAWLAHKGEKFDTDAPLEISPERWAETL